MEKIQKLSFEKLDSALSYGLLQLGVFEQNYGGFITALLAKSLDDAGFIWGKLNGGDEDAIAMQSYLGNSAGGRFPMGSGRTLTEALQELITVLESVSQDDFVDWVRDVQLAYESLIQADKKYCGKPNFLTLALDAGELRAVN